MRYLDPRILKPSALRFLGIWTPDVLDSRVSESLGSKILDG